MVSISDLLTIFVYLVGLVALAQYLYDNLKSVVSIIGGVLEPYFQPQLPQKLVDKYGKWAAVTGSTDGIGKAYAQELARRGLNIVLISRSLIKLQQLSKEIENECGVETFLIQTDFSSGASVYEHLFQELAKKPIGILVNNVGIGHNPPGTLSSFTPEHLWDMININIGAATLLSRHFVEKWCQSGFKGCIVNLSSCLALQPIPYGSVYGASKAYIRSLTLALRQEVEPFGITVQLVSPIIVVTQIHKYSRYIMKRGGSIFVHPVGEYGKWAVETLGKVDETTGYFWQGVLITIWNMIHVRLRPKLLAFGAKTVTDDLSNIQRKLQL